MPNNPIGQHRVPRFLLRRFANAEGTLHCFDKVRNKFYVGPPRNVFVENHIYTVKYRDGVSSFEMEKALSELEGVASDIAEHIVARARAHETPNLSRSDMNVLKEFLVIQWRRTSERYRSVQDRERDDVLNEAMDQTERAFPGEDVRSHLNSFGMDKLFRNSWIMSLGYELPDWLPSKGLAVVVSPVGNASLIIGSNPVLLAGKDRSKPDGEVILPIASDVAVSLALKKGEEQLFIDHDERLVRMINSHVFRQSDAVAASERVDLATLSAAWRKRQRKASQAKQLSRNKR